MADQWVLDRVRVELPPGAHPDAACRESAVREVRESVASQLSLRPGSLLGRSDVRDVTAYTAAGAFDLEVDIVVRLAPKSAPP